MRRAWVLAAVGALGALGALAAPCEARLVMQHGPAGDTWVNVPEAAGEGLIRPSARRLAFRDVIEEAGRKHGVDPDLVEAVVACESNFDPEAVSKAGACGLMQLMPETAAAHGLRDPFDVAGNVDAGTRHLAGLLKSLGDRRLALAAYNAGLGAVQRAGGIPRYPETQRYVRKIEGYLSLLRGDPVVEFAPPDVQPSAPVADVAEVSAPPAPPRPAPRKAPGLQLGRDATGRIVITNLPGSRTSLPGLGPGRGQ